MLNKIQSDIIIRYDCLKLYFRRFKEMLVIGTLIIIYTVHVISWINTISRKWIHKNVKNQFTLFLPSAAATQMNFYKMNQKHSAATFEDNHDKCDENHNSHEDNRGKCDDNHHLNEDNHHKYDEYHND